MHIDLFFLAGLAVIFFGGVALVATAITKYTAANRFRKRAAQEALERQTQREAERAEQDRLGTILFDRISEAAGQNPKVTDDWRLLVGKLPQNGGAYSVLVTLKEPDWKGCMSQFDVYPDRLRWLYGPYGPSEEAPLADFQQMLEKARQRVIAFA